MQEKPDKKPDFLKDLNNGILEDLTKGGKIKNAVGITGEVIELKQINNICRLPFAGYLGKIKAMRPSGIADEVVIAFEESAAAGKPDKGSILSEFSAGSRLLIQGKMQTLKDFTSGRVLVFVLASYVALCPKAMQQNDIALVGEIASTPKHRETPRGKRITDIFIKTQNVLTAGACYIPCICWQEQADEVAGWQQGDKVKLLARYQSREYEKHIERQTKDGTEDTKEIRTAYELSVCQIRKAD